LLESVSWGRNKTRGLSRALSSVPLLQLSHTYEELKSIKKQAKIVQKNKLLSNSEQTVLFRRPTASAILHKFVFKFNNLHKFKTICINFRIHLHELFF